MTSIVLKGMETLPRIGSFSQSRLLSPISCPPLDLRETLTPKSVQQSIQFTDAQNLWRCMHSPSLKEITLPRHKHTHSLTSLSALTKLANSQLGSVKRGEDLCTQTAFNATQSHSTKFPSDSDFKRIIEKLDRVYSQGGVDSLKVALQEGKSHEILLESHEKAFGRIALQNHLCPLVVLLTRARGRLVCYVSRIEQEPVEVNCDARVTGDRIWVSDPSTRFHGGSLYIGFHALEETAFSVTVQFGQKKKIARDKGKSIAVGPDEWEQWLEALPEHKPRYAKDFLARNRMVQRLDSPESVAYQLAKMSTVDLRRKEAVRKWKQLQGQKKQRALDLLNRQQIKEQERLRQLERDREKAAIEGVKARWLALIWAVHGFEGLLDKFTRRKAILAVENTRMAAARRLQRAFRRGTGRATRIRLALTRCSVSLCLTVRHWALLDDNNVETTLQTLIADSCKLARVPVQFREFYKKVIRLQTEWRDTLQRHKQLQEQLLTVWTVCMSQLLSQVSKKKPAIVRGKKVKENPTVRYLNITSATRSSVLQAHFQAAKRKLWADCRAYVKDTGSKPAFHCIPSNEEMIRMIERTADLAEAL